MILGGTRPKCYFRLLCRPKKRVLGPTVSMACKGTRACADRSPRSVVLYLFSISHSGRPLGVLRPGVCCSRRTHRTAQTSLAPTLSQSRVFLPAFPGKLSSRRSFSFALSLFPPGRWSARVGCVSVPSFVHAALRRKSSRKLGNGRTFGRRWQWGLRGWGFGRTESLCILRSSLGLSGSLSLRSVSNAGSTYFVPAEKCSEVVGAVVDLIRAERGGGKDSREVIS